MTVYIDGGIVGKYGKSSILRYSFSCPSIRVDWSDRYEIFWPGRERHFSKLHAKHGLHVSSSF